MLGVITAKFSSSKVGIVHKYHNHGRNRHVPNTGSFATPRGFSLRGRPYSTTPAHGAHAFSFVAGKGNVQTYVNVPWDETAAITRTRPVMASMLQYLASINSPLHTFLLKHKRLAELSAQVVLYDMVHDLYVLFPTKASVSQFIWGAKNRSQALDRYLYPTATGAKVAYIKVLQFYLQKDLPAGTPVISTADYFKHINSDRFKR